MMKQEIRVTQERGHKLGNLANLKTLEKSRKRIPPPPEPPEGTSSLTIQETEHTTCSIQYSFQSVG